MWLALPAFKLLATSKGIAQPASEQLLDLSNPPVGIFAWHLIVTGIAMYAVCIGEFGLGEIHALVVLACYTGYVVTNVLSSILMSKTTNWEWMLAVGSVVSLVWHSPTAEVIDPLMAQTGLVIVGYALLVRRYSTTLATSWLEGFTTGGMLGCLKTPETFMIIGFSLFTYSAAFAAYNGMLLEAKDALWSLANQTADGIDFDGNSIEKSVVNQSWAAVGDSNATQLPELLELKHNLIALPGCTNNPSYYWERTGEWTVECESDAGHGTALAMDQVDTQVPPGWPTVAYVLSLESSESQNYLSRKAFLKRHNIELRLFPAVDGAAAFGSRYSVRNVTRPITEQQKAAKSAGNGDEFITEQKMVYMDPDTGIESIEGEKGFLKPGERGYTASMRALFKLGIETTDGSMDRVMVIDDDALFSCEFERDLTLALSQARCASPVMPPPIRAETDASINHDFNGGFTSYFGRRLHSMGPWSSSAGLSEAGSAAVRPTTSGGAQILMLGAAVWISGTYPYRGDYSGGWCVAQHRRMHAVHYVRVWVWVNSRK